MVTDCQKLAVRAGEAAQLLDVCKRTLHDLTYPRGPIRTVVVSKRVKYPISELQRYIDDQLKSDEASK